MVAWIARKQYINSKICLPETPGKKKKKKKRKTENAKRAIQTVTKVHPLPSSWLFGKPWTFNNTPVDALVKNDLFFFLQRWNLSSHYYVRTCILTLWMIIITIIIIIILWKDSINGYLYERSNNATNTTNFKIIEMIFYD